MNIVMLGPQGSGKGTQAKMMTERYGIPHISSGDMLREEISKGTRLGKKAEDIINKGSLIPDEMMVAVLKERITKSDCKKGFILDGFPRTLPQAEALDRITKLSHAVHVKISDREAIKRLSDRWQCRKCNMIYGKINMPKNKKCECGGSLYQRDDDKPEAIKKRLDEYHKKTDPLVDYYKKKKILAEINGEQSVDKVFQDIIKAL